MGKPQKPVAWSPIVPIRSGSATKLNGGGIIDYEVGREHNQLHIRITKNDSSGTFGKEWIAWSAIRPLLDKAKLGGATVHASLFRGIITSKSQNTPGFLAAMLRQEGILAATEEGAAFSTVTGDPEAWEAAAMQLFYVPAIEPPPMPEQPSEPTAASETNSGAKGKRGKKIEPQPAKVENVDMQQSGDGDGGSNATAPDAVQQAPMAEVAVIPASSGNSDDLDCAAPCVDAQVDESLATPGEADGSSPLPLDEPISPDTNGGSVIEKKRKRKG